MTTTGTHNRIEERRIIQSQESFITSLLSVRVKAPHTPKEEVLRAVYTLMLQAGCKGYTREQFLNAIGESGVRLSITADAEYTTFKFQSRNEVLPKALILYKAMLTTPTWSTKELMRVKEYIKNQLILANEDARTRAHEHFANTCVINGDWRYSYENTELSDALKTITVADLKKLHASVFKSEWLHTIGGEKQHCEKVSKMLAILPHENIRVQPEEHASVLIPQKGKLILTDIPHKQNVEFSIGAPLPFSIQNPAFPAFLFGISVLGIYGGFTGRLMSTVREKEGLTYMIYAAAEDISMHSEGWWRISTFFSPKDTQNGVVSTLREVELMRIKGISEDELRRFKEILKTRHVLVHDSLNKTVQAVHARQKGGVSEEAYTEIQKKIQNLTVKEVNDVMKTYLETTHLIISGAGPVSGLKKGLEKIIHQK